MDKNQSQPSSTDHTEVKRLEYNRKVRVVTFSVVGIIVISSLSAESCIAFDVEGVQTEGAYLEGTNSKGVGLREGRCMERFMNICTKIKIVASEVASTIVFLSILFAGVYVEISHLLGTFHK
jgi:hypothetical protein